jgi:hypothetical protein
MEGIRMFAPCEQEDTFVFILDYVAEDLEDTSLAMSYVRDNKKIRMSNELYRKFLEFLEDFEIKM